MNKVTETKKYKEYVETMLNQYSDVLTKVMFDDFEIRAKSEKDDEFSSFTMYLNTLITSLQHKDKEIKEKTAELNKYQGHLEDLVKKRTPKLSKTNKKFLQPRGSRNRHIRKREL